MTEDGYTLSLIANRLRGETAQFDITNKKGEVLVTEGTRITARHIREMEKLNLTELSVPAEYVCGHRLAKNMVDEETGEIVVPCNAIITPEILEQLRGLNVTGFETIYTNDLDHGPFMADTLDADPCTNRLEALVEIYRMMRPGEPPTKEAAENLLTICFSRLIAMT